MSWLEKLKKGHKQLAQGAQESNLEMYKQKLKGIVYDDEIVAELAPIFAELHSAEGFDKVFELLTTKEQQIEAISGGDWLNKEEEDKGKKEITNEEQAEESEVKSAEDILKEKFSNN